MKRLPVLAAILASAFMARAQSTNSFPLWPEGAPGALGQSANDIPTLTVYRPKSAKATGAAMVICPGGGYAHLAPHEGDHYARWLNESDPRTLHELADEFGVSAERIRQIEAKAMQKMRASMAAVR